MRFCHAFLASLLILLAITVTAEKSTRSSSIPDVGYNRGRLLRKADAAKASAIDTEDRGAWSSIKNWAKMEYWITTSKSDDQVKKALKMEGLTGAALKDHPNYKKLEEFWYKLEGRGMDISVLFGTPTYKFWYQFGLGRMNEAQRQSSNKFRMYVRYATKYDNAMWNRRNNIFHPPKIYEVAPEEMRVIIQIWVKAKRTNSYVKKVLGLDGLSKAERQGDLNNRYFLEFLKLTERSER